MIRHCLFCRSWCHYCDRNCVKTCPRIAEIKVKLWYVTRTTPLIYGVKVIPKFLLIPIVFPNTWWKNEDTRWHSARDIRCFNLFLSNQFYTFIRKTKLYSSSYIVICKRFENVKKSQRSVTIFVFHSTSKSTKKWSKIVENNYDNHWPSCCWIWNPVELFDCLLSSGRFDVGSFFRNIHASK